MSTASEIRLSDAVYSVWSDWARLAVKAYVGVDEIEIVGSDGSDGRASSPAIRRPVHRLSPLPAR